ncbi:MAG: DNA-binding domain-containing protein [Vulcanimicrobiota bacterium]
MAEREVVSNSKALVLPEPSPAGLSATPDPCAGPQSLREQQAWLQNVVTCVPGQLAGALERTPNYIKQGYGLDAESRLWIYRAMFPMRMVESMQVDFPGVAYALGPDVFHDFVMSYVEEHPSSSWTLNHLGSNFAGYIGKSNFRYRTFLHDLATLEWNLAQVFDEPELPWLQSEALQSLAPEDWEDLVLKPRPTSRLLKFSYPVSHFLFQVDNGLEPPRPVKNPQRVLIMRKGYQMNRVVLPEAGYFVLKDLFSGKKLAQAIERLVQKYPAVGADDLQRWFAQWGDWGVFQA